MVLDLAKALSFFACVLGLYRAAMCAFFVPGAGWEDRLVPALARLGLAACLSLLSAFLFTWPAPSNPDRHSTLSATLPVRVFLWSSAVIAVLFLSAWYLGDLVQQAAPFISSRSHEGL